MYCASSDLAKNVLNRADDEFQQFFTTLHFCILVVIKEFKLENMWKWLQPVQNQFKKSLIHSVSF
jgi:hypothetical protein